MPQDSGPGAAAHSCSDTILQAERPGRKFGRALPAAPVPHRNRAVFTIPMAFIIAIEGTDGTGKATQSTLLERRLREAGLRAAVLSFPTYEKTFFGREVAAYLNGQFGGLYGVHPKLAAVLYAGDRFENRDRIAALQEAHDVLIFDRYTWSNVAHQSVKLPAGERAAFAAWVEELEFTVFGLPRPDRVVFLDMPPEEARRLVLSKPDRAYTTKKLDLHEDDLAYLKDVHAVYAGLMDRPGWVRIPCIAGGALRTVEEVHAALWEALGAGGVLAGLGLAPGRESENRLENG